MNEQALSQCALFVELTPDELALVVGEARQYSVPENHMFFDMGVSNESLFVVLSGSVRIERPGTEIDIELRKLSSGAIFGEMSFIDSSKTIAKVSTVERTEVLELNSTDFHRILTDQPALASKLWRNLALEFKRRIAITTDLVDYYADLSQVLRDNPGAANLLGT
jgi:CRP-like cAMP-binding protein